ncbi:hypothetical protein IQ277_16510 [Nostocales cyanobacterium LEGE 12452]|nr:hypothetical protein [Nostocales cyanobacterium LEGE 12452]
MLNNFIFTQIRDVANALTKKRSLRQRQGRSLKFSPSLLLCVLCGSLF